MNKQIVVGEFYNVTRLMPIEDNQYIFDVEISHVSESPRVDRAACDTIEQVIVLLEGEMKELKNIEIEASDHSENYEENVKSFWFTAQASTNHCKDYSIDITIGKLKSEEDFNKLLVVVTQFNAKVENTDLKIMLISLEKMNIPVILRIGESFENSKHIIIRKVSSECYIINGFSITYERLNKCPTYERLMFLAKFPINDITLQRVD